MSNDEVKDYVGCYSEIVERWEAFCAFGLTHVSQNEKETIHATLFAYSSGYKLVERWDKGEHVSPGFQ